jgi:purine-nucleoside phosphorylase
MSSLYFTAGVVMKQASYKLAARRVLKLSNLRPKLAIVLGTGFDCGPNLLQNEVRVPYEKIPGFPPVGVSGHAGELVIGNLGGQAVIILRGRAHFYEGHSMSLVTFGVRVLAACGVHDVLFTNAAGAVNRNLTAGDLMVIEDHINFMGVNPLRGVVESDASRFVDLSRAYDPDLKQLLARAAKCCGLRLKKGVYLAVCGPSYETPAEIRAFRRLGADAVGMSTVPEVIVARQCGLRVAAVSCITNVAGGGPKNLLSHREVLAAASRIKGSASQLLAQFAKLHRNRSGIEVSD